MEYIDDFYNEPSEFEIQVEEFKQSLIESVKKEYKQEMERLRKENADLAEFKRQKENVDREISELKRQREIDKQEAIRQAKHERLFELMGGFEVEMWTPEYYYEESRKCDRCNDQRLIHYKTPLGKETYESCSCSNRIEVYSPAKNILRKISTRNDWGKVENTWLYYQIKNDCDYDSAEYRSDSSAKNLFKPGVTTFEEVDNQYSPVYFENYDDCYQFCMWKMQKDAGILTTDPTK